jgi:hypothetical protein
LYWWATSWRFLLLPSSVGLSHFHQLADDRIFVLNT